MSKKDNFITVNQLNTTIKDTLTAQFNNQLKVKGELSNIKGSGLHTYLTLKDSESSISVVAWNTKFTNLNNGDDVMVTGKIACFIKGGSYQLSASKIERIGIGHLHEVLEQNKKIFLEKGYFTKSQLFVPLPNTIKSIGILTAKEGAALHDILYVLKNNMFHGKVFIKNCSVQGQLCPQSVSEGIAYFNDLNKTNPINILIVSRGGGSFEDLIGYSSKEIVRAIHKTSIYTISAVGHEVDTMLSDFSANYRAPTPSVAAEVVSSIQKKKREELLHNLEQVQTLKLQIKNKIASFKELIKSSLNLLQTVNPLNYLTNELNKLDTVKYNIQLIVKNSINKCKNEIEKYEAKNLSFSPAQTFENGYVAIIDEQNNLINSLELFNKSKQKLKIVFIDGEIELPTK